jgi:enoyl-CoA hydratase/carnithine racemase
MNVDTMDSGDILHCRQEGGIATLTLNRPDHYNALSEQMLSVMQAVLDEIARDESVRVVVITGTGKAFCAGHDLKQMRDSPSREYYDALFTQCAQVMQTITTLPQPVIAKVQGIAAAAGCQLVASCDLAIAVDSARFAVSGINVGLFCATPAVALSRNVSRKRAFEMLVTGDFIDAHTAVRYGLINYAVAAEDLDEAVMSLADKICAKSQTAIRSGKGMFYAQLEKGVQGAYQYAATKMACNMVTEDAREGIDAFMQKRKPVWKDR